MGKCQIKGCNQIATKTLARPTSEAERDDEINQEGGWSFNYQIEAYVCDEHLELGKKEYPLELNKEPYT